jgi:TonB-linked SusC/RagA family outer membrane protein
VIAVGASAGAATDFDGNFTLSVSPDAVLSVSYIGYETQQVAVNGQTQLKITLKENSVVLDEVVAIGYGTVKKEDATGSVSVMKPDEIEAGLATSAQDLLVGKSPGVVVTSGGGDPQAGATIRIRGGASLNANNDPLIVIDGVPIDNSGVQGMSNPLAMVSPDNVESMTVLKDASATAIYGSRASNGVIIITTKKGQAGKPQVNFTANMYVNHARNTWEVLDADAYRALMTQYWGEGSEAVLAMGNANTNWQDEVLRTTISHDYSLSVGGTAGFLPYRVSANYTKSNGIIKTSSMDRVTAGINLTPKFFDDHLSVQLNAKGYYFKNNFGDSGSVGAAVAMDPTHPVYTDYAMAEGSAGKLFNGYTTWESGGLANINATQNPVSILMDRNNYADVLRSNGNLQLDYSVHFLPELHLNLNLGYDWSQTNEYNTIAQNSPTAWRSYKKNGASVETYKYERKINTLLDFYANYKKDIDAIDSNIDVTVGYSWQNFDNYGWNDNGVFMSAGYQNPVNNNGVYSLVIDEASKDAIGSVFENKPRYQWMSELQLVSFFGRINYSLKDTYLLTFTLRDDATSRFHKDSRWGLFPSAALAWKISNMDFFKDATDVMNEFKLRLGWGVTGQQDIGSLFPYMAVYQSSIQGSYYPGIINPVGSNGEYVYYPTLYPGGYDPNIKWEETTTYNAGIDVAFLGNRITASLDWYLRDTKDLLSYVTVPIGSATTNEMNKNIGTLRNLGVEFAINARPIVTKDFTWTVDYNVAWNKNEITKLNSTDDPNYFINTGDISGTGNTVQAHKVGYPAYSFYLYEQVYDANGKPIEGEYVDQNGDGQITGEDRVLRHQKDPKVTMSLSNTFSYKNWDFGIVLRSNIGNYVYNNVLSDRTVLGDTWKNSNLSNLVVNDFYFDGTLEESKELKLSDYYLRNASFLRCDNITLGYTWQNLLNNNLRLRLFGAVQNPFVITKYNGLDPEVFSGIDGGVYPRPTTYSLGLVATF